MTRSPVDTGVLYVTSEVVPLVKTGGLADVSAALPAALRRIGVDVRVLVPGYDGVLDAVSYKRKRVTLILPHFPPATLLTAKLPDGVPLLIIDCPPLYRRAGGPYQDADGTDWPDNALRFGLLSRVAALLGGDESALSWRPAIVHGNDWQCGLAPAYLKFAGSAAASVLTIHNLAFQGIFPPASVGELGLPASSFSVDGVEFHGSLSFLKAGLFYADAITTVSPTYAREIQGAALGFGLQGLLASRSTTLAGIMNGIDGETWNPASDPMIAQRYDVATLDAKAANKRALQTRLGLAQTDDTPLFGMVSRLTEQKGLDLVIDIAPELIALPAQLAILGAGDAKLQQGLSALAASHPEAIAVINDFDDPLAHQIEAGADMFLMPSRFEPCGLNQMYSQRYGTPPIVRATGGLADSVIDHAVDNSERATGFVFDNADPDDFLEAIKRALVVYRDRTAWRRIQRNGMVRDFSWDASAEKYRQVYESLD